MDTAKICASAICATLFCLLLRQKNPAAAMLVALAGGLYVTVCLLPTLGEVFAGLSDIMAAGGIDSAKCINIIKVTGIAYFTEICSGLCRDAGESALAAKLEIAGRVAVLALTVPVVKGLIEVISDALSLL